MAGRLYILYTDWFFFSIFAFFFLRQKNDDALFVWLERVLLTVVVEILFYRRGKCFKSRYIDSAAGNVKWRRQCLKSSKFSLISLLMNQIPNKHTYFQWKTHVSIIYIRVQRQEMIKMANSIFCKTFNTFTLVFRQNAVKKLQNNISVKFIIYF